MEIYLHAMPETYFPSVSKRTKEFSIDEWQCIKKKSFAFWDMGTWRAEGFIVELANEATFQRP